MTGFMNYASAVTVLGLYLIIELRVQVAVRDEKRNQEESRLHKWKKMCLLFIINMLICNS